MCLYDHFRELRQVEREKKSYNVVAIGWIVESFGAVLNAMSLIGKMMIKCID